MKRHDVLESLEKITSDTIVGGIASFILACISIFVPGVSLVQPGAKVISNTMKKCIQKDLQKEFEREIEDELQECLNNTIERMALEAKSTGLQCFEKYKEQFKIALEQNGYFNKETNPSPNEMEDNLIHCLPQLEDNEIVMIRGMFKKAFHKSLFFLPRLNAYLLSIAVNRLDEDVKTTTNKLSERIDRMEDFNEDIAGFIKDELIHKMRVWSERDGMMHAFSVFFQIHLMENNVDTRIVRLLSRLQDYYNFDYATYNAIPIGQNVNAGETPFTFDLIERNTIYEQNEPLFECYIDFVNADNWYFNEQYADAANAYESVKMELEKLYGKYNDAEMDIAKLYIGNSIGWALHRAEVINQLSPSNRSIEAYKYIFPDNNEIRKWNHYISTYRRNYGVCLEYKGEYMEALTQYKIALSTLPDHPRQYKPYITFCSALMKEWDRRYGKTTPLWADNIKNAHNCDEWDICDDNIEMIRNHLIVAQNIKNDFADIYVQRAKLLTYELLYNVVDEREQKRAIERELFFARSFSTTGQRGYIFTQRDFYYALSLIHSSEGKEAWLRLCKECNDMLGDKGDAVTFASIIENMMSK